MEPSLCRALTAMLALLTGSGVAACSSRTLVHDGGGADSADGAGDDDGEGAAGAADVRPDTQGCGVAPLHHRAAEGPPCPTERAAGAIPEMCVLDGGPPPGGDCRQDSDCTAGVNGRCLQVRGCYLACSYDQCFQDADCAGNVPCQCRDSASSGEANRCLPNSNCRIDDDCGPGGTCSPSQLGGGCIRMCAVVCATGTHCYAGTTEVPCWCGQSCGAGYFCHTPSDACTNDCECTGESACTHQPTGTWACIPCAAIP